MVSSDLRSRYLDLLEKSLRNAIYGESPLEMRWRAIFRRLRHPYATRHGALRWPAQAHTMLSAARLRHLRELVELTIEENIPGDYIETGVWRGGACIMIKGVLTAHQIHDRLVYCADTFAGLPRPDAKHRADRGDRLHAFRELAVSEEAVRRNFAAYDLLDDRVACICRHDASLQSRTRGRTGTAASSPAPCRRTRPRSARYRRAAP